eukprot:569074-Prorocentrum_minimum.AAC.1
MIRRPGGEWEARTGGPREGATIRSGGAPSLPIKGQALHSLERAPEGWAPEGWAPEGWVPPRREWRQLRRLPPPLGVISGERTAGRRWALRQ